MTKVRFAPSGVLAQRVRELDPALLAQIAGAAIRDRLRSPYDDEVRAAMTAVLARSTEDDLPALGATLDALRGDPRAFHVAAATLTGHDVRARASWRQAAAEFEAVALRDPRQDPGW